MKKFRCIVVDDEPLAVRLLSDYVTRCDQLELVGGYTSAVKAMEVLQSDNIDIAFLDIQMPQLNGLEIARALESKNTSIVFITAFRNYAFEGFRVHAIDYLLKPVSFDEFSASVDRITGMLQDSVSKSDEQAKYLTVRSDYRLVRIAFDDVLYIEGLKDYVKIHTTCNEHPILTLMSMKSIEQTLPEDQFMRIHRSFIIALKHIKSFDRASVMVDNTSIPIGATYRTRLKKLI